MRNRLLFVPLMAGALALVGAATQPDEAVIANSGSTNTPRYTISVRSDATGSTRIADAATEPFALSPDVANRFFSDLRAARSDSGMPRHCMKSASFGISTVVHWQGWTSPDLQCPPFNAAVGALASDVQAILAESHVSVEMRGRIGIPPSLRKIPPPTPEVQPT